MEQSSLELLHSLKNAQWIVAAKTYGNNHSTLIGLLVSWWISLSPKNNWALEGGPSYGYHEKGLGGGICDALLGEDKDAIAVLEVEGPRGKYTAEKIGKFFAAEFEYYKSLRFGILLLYAYIPKGRGASRFIPSARDPETLAEVARVSAMYPQKFMVVITLDKKYGWQSEGVRARNEYYGSSVNSITGYLFERGKEIASCSFTW